MPRSRIVPNIVFKNNHNILYVIILHILRYNKLCKSTFPYNIVNMQLYIHLYEITHCPRSTLQLITNNEYTTHTRYEKLRRIF